MRLCVGGCLGQAGGNCFLALDLLNGSTWLCVLNELDLNQRAPTATSVNLRKWLGVLPSICALSSLLGNHPQGKKRKNRKSRKQLGRAKGPFNGVHHSA